jgi:hypothetical protein
MRYLAIACTAAALALVLSGCTSATIEYRRPARGVEAAPAARPSLGIPPGHLPPPGSCRIWVPGRPPGRQSPPGDCATLARNVPAGAWLLTRTPRDPAHVDVSVYDHHRPQLVIEVRIYDAETGSFIGVRGEKNL